MNPARARFILLAAVTIVLALTRSAFAGDPFDASGRWKQGPLREEYTVQQWLPGCGPAPVSTTLGGGEVIAIHQDGDELTLAGGGRVFKSNQCYDVLPTLARDAHSREASGRAWRTRCTTPPADPRRATMNTLLSATSDTHIDLVETGRYEISLTEGRCIADVKRSRTFDLIARDAPAATAAPPATAPPAPTAAAPAVRTCDNPGEPARLEVRPSRKVLRTGDSFTFRAVVMDAKGCATGTSTTWALGSAASGGGSARATLEPNGRVTIPQDSGEGSVDLMVTAAGKSAHVTIDVSSSAHYDELLAKSGLNAAGENDNAAVAELATGTIGGSDAKAEDTAKRRKMIFIGVVGGLALVLGIVAFVFSRRTKRAAALEADAEARHAELVREADERRREKRAAHDAAVRAHEESLKQAKEAANRQALATSGIVGGSFGDTVGMAPPDDRLAGARMMCPTCRREYGTASSYCPMDATRLVPFNGAEAPTTRGAICPACKRGFDAGLKVCPHDQEELVPYAMHAAAPRPQAAGGGDGGTLGAIAAKGKICPTCGGRFDGAATFCGKDGTALVLLN